MARFILIVFVIIVIINLLVRVVLPWRLRKMAKRMQDQMNENQNRYNRSERKEGEVTVEKDKNTSNSKGFPTDGEYVDYEEVED